MIVALCMPSFSVAAVAKAKRQQQVSDKCVERAKATMHQSAVKRQKIRGSS